MVSILARAGIKCCILSFLPFISFITALCQISAQKSSLYIEQAGKLISHITIVSGSAVGCGGHCRLNQFSIHGWASYRPMRETITYIILFAKTLPSHGEPISFHSCISYFYVFIIFNGINDNPLNKVWVQCPVRYVAGQHNSRSWTPGFIVTFCNTQLRWRNWLKCELVQNI